jgi:phosphatidylserine/phosphatidylglycerophosphate/cardiolipin synthase-like enzyme
MTLESDDVRIAALGVLLAYVSNPAAAGRAVVEYLSAPSPSRIAGLEAAGIKHESVEALRPILGPTESYEELCHLAAAWAYGRTAVRRGRWEPVVGGVAFEEGSFERHTGETIVALLAGARRVIRMYAPYLDDAGLRAVGDSICDAVERGAELRFAHLEGASRDAAVARFVAALPSVPHIVTTRISQERHFPHLKLIAVDGDRAYVGSANLTWTGITRNLEIGALVEGDGVRTIELMFDTICEEEAVAEGSD